MVATNVMRIVLIEDNDADAYLIQEALRQSGIDFDLRHLNNGDDALRHLCGEAEPPSLVLLDLHLPGLGGPEILSALRENPRLVGVPVIIVSGAATDWLKTVDLRGSLSLIHKSMDVEDYLRSIRDAVKALQPLAGPPGNSRG